MLSSVANNIVNRLVHWLKIMRGRKAGVSCAIAGTRAARHMRAAGKQQRRETACSVGVERPLRMPRRAWLAHLAGCKASECGPLFRTYGSARHTDSSAYYTQFPRAVDPTALHASPFGESASREYLRNEYSLFRIRTLNRVSSSCSLCADLSSEMYSLQQYGRAAFHFCRLT